jgi:hypothetical protein
MSVITRSTLLALAVSFVSAQQSTFPATPLASKHYAYPTGIPYKVDTDTNLIRGQQFGFNICNSTTENQNSNCQTSFLNSLMDFCLWGPSEPNQLVSNKEGEMIAWCTKPGRGTRLIPAGAIQGVQFMKTPAYVQVVGYLDQAQLNINSTDFGGEMDPHGADLRGNPMGGLVYSNGFGSNTDLNAFTQVIEWHNFMGSNTFCFKACDPSNPNAANFCQHVYDRIGCAYNAPNNAQNGTFESCLGDNQDFPGVYTDSTGATQTYHQPPESLGPIPQLTWTARVPASSSCVTHQSTEIFSALLSVTASETGLGGGPTATPKPSGSTGTTKGSSSTKAPGATSTSSDAQAVVASGLVGLLGVVFSVLAFA